MLSEALALVSRQVLAPERAAPGSADLAAFVNPGRSELEQAWQALEPGGVLYAEWYRPRPGGPAALRRRLEALGFTVAGSYWPWPWPERATPAFWLPLEAPAAIRYFLESRPQAHSLPGRALRRGLQLGWRLGDRAGLLAPVCIVAHKPLAGGPPPGSLAARAARWGLSEDGADLDWLLLTGGLHSTNKVTALVFQGGAAAPSYVAKMPRRELSLSSLEREAEVLEAVHSRRGRPLEGVPELVFLSASDQDDFPAIGETHLSGVPLYTAMQPERIEDLARQATRWLLELVEPGPPQPPAAWWDRLVEPVLRDFEQGYAEVGGLAVLEAARAELSRLGALPLAVEHRDFSPWNVFLTPSGNLSVLDWEGAEPSGLPFTDLVYFLAYLTFFAEDALDSGETPDAYRRMLAPHTRMGGIAAACFHEYSTAARLPEASLHPLRLLTWLRHAVLERALIENSSLGRPDPQLLRRGLYLSLLKTDLELNADG